MKLNRLLLVLLVAATASGQEKDQTKTSQTNSEGKKITFKSYLNQRAPEFIVEKWLTEEPVLKGKFLFIDFWATWCGPCRAAIPDANKFQQRFRDKLVVIGVSNEPEAVVRKLTNPAIKYYSAIDTKERMKRKLELRGIPHVIIVDPQGIVRWEGFPFLHHNIVRNYELMERVIEELIAKYSN